MSASARFARKHWYRLRSIWTMLAGFTNPPGTIALFAGLGGDQRREIGVRGSDVRFVVRDAMDAWCLKETLLDRFYERYGAPVEPGWTVLDIGAGIGDYTVASGLAARDGKVIAFEPFPESFALLRENVERNGVTNAVLVEAAVTGVPRSLVLDVSSGEPLTYGSVEHAATGRGEVAIASVTLGEVLEHHQLDRIDLVKLDCEGGEYDILLNSPPGVIARIHRVVMEYHDHTTPHRHGELVTFLRRAGFEVETFPSPVHPDRIGYLGASRPIEQE